MSKIIGIIPARMDSSRFPGKALVPICGIPMIGHVYLRSIMSKLLDEVYVATCDKEIADYVYSIEGKVVMTADTHKRASDRVAEAVLKIEDSINTADIVVMVQGDEPMVFPQMITEATKPLIVDERLQVVNLIADLDSAEDYNNPNIVKVVVDKNNFALYFSREPIPSSKKYGKVIFGRKQVPIIPFRRDFLFTFNGLFSTPLEITESVDMLRVLEHGYKVKMVPTKYEVYEIDTPQDLDRVERLMEKDNLFLKYKQMINRQ
jgi:3-deoxy-manno-octulosonate cytidylyltransferase (CMP-KDO synthetase)